MKQFLKYLCMLLAAAVLVCAGGTAMAAKKVVAVPAVEPSRGLGLEHHVAQDFDQQLVTVLVQSGRYDVCERAQLDKVMSELALSQTGIISGDTAIRFGEMTGADYTVIGNVIAADFGSFNNYLYKGHKAKVKFNFKFVDNRSGIVKFSEIVEGSKTTTEFENKNPNRDMMLSDAVNDASRKVLALINEKNGLAGVIAHVSGVQVYIDIGEEMGVKAGEKYAIVREGTPIIHPVTHEILGIEEIPVGEMKVTEVKPNYSVGDITKGEGRVQTGDKVKRIGKK